MSAACWTCGQAAGYRHPRLGVALCGSECRRRAEAATPVRVAADAHGFKALAAAAPSLCGPRGRWRVHGGAGLLVPQAVSAAMTEHAARIGPRHGRDASGNVDGDDNERQAGSVTAAPLGATRGAYGLLDLLPTDVPCMVFAGLPADELIGLARDSRAAYLELFDKLSVLLQAKNLPKMYSEGLSTTSLFYAMLTALRIGDRDNFNVAAHIYVVEAMRKTANALGESWALGPLGRFSDTKMFWREAPFEQSVDYYELCLPSAANLLWMEAVRETHPEQWARALVQDGDAVLAEWMDYLAKIYWGNRWFVKRARGGITAEDIFVSATVYAKDYLLPHMLALRDDRIRMAADGKFSIDIDPGLLYGRTSKTGQSLGHRTAAAVTSIRSEFAGYTDDVTWRTLVRRFPASPLLDLPEEEIGKAPIVDLATLTAAKRRAEAFALEVRRASAPHLSTPSSSATAAAASPAATPPARADWEDVDARIAAMLIGPRRARDASGNADGDDDDDERQAAAPRPAGAGETVTPLAERGASAALPLATTRGAYGYLDLLPTDALRMVLVPMPAAELIGLARDSLAAYLELFVKLRALLPARGQDLAAQGLFVVPLLYAMLAALRISDRDNFNVAAHLMTVELMRDLGPRSPFSSTSEFLHAAPFAQTLDYYALCLPSSTNLLWLEAVREMDPVAWESVIVRPHAAGQPAVGGGHELMRIAMSIQRAYWGEWWYLKHVSSGAWYGRLLELAELPEQFDAISDLSSELYTGVYDRISEIGKTVGWQIAAQVRAARRQVLAAAPHLAVITWETLAQRFPASPLLELPAEQIGTPPVIDPALLFDASRRAAEFSRALAASSSAAAAAAAAPPAAALASSSSSAATPPARTGWMDVDARIADLRAPTRSASAVAMKFV